MSITRDQMKKFAMAVKGVPAAAVLTKAIEEEELAKQRDTVLQIMIQKAEVTSTVAFELKMIGDTVYALKNGNVYEWDTVSEARSDFVGRLTGDAEDPSIDTDALETYETGFPEAHQQQARIEKNLLNEMKIATSNAVQAKKEQTAAAFAALKPHLSRLILV